MIHCCRECLFASVNYCWGSYKHYLNSHLKTHTTHEVLRFFTLYYLQSFSLHFFSHLGSSHLHRRSNKITKLQLSHDTFTLWQVNCSSLPKGTVELCDKNSVLVIKNKQHRRKTTKTQHWNNIQDQTASTVHIPENLKAEACSCKVIEF